MNILRAIGNFLGMLLGFIFLAAIAAILGTMLLGSFWLDTAGVEKDAVVAAKYERISFKYAGWTRTLELGLQRDDGPMADIRRTMIGNHDGHPELVGIEKVRVPTDVYDRFRVGQTVKVRVQPPGFFKNLVIFPQVRLVGVSTASIAYSLYESLWPLPEFFLTMLPAALLGWLAFKTNKWLWAASALTCLMALAYWALPISDRRPSGAMAEAEGKVVALKLVDQIMETEESVGEPALVPHLNLAIEFIPEGANGPVVAVDRVDAASVSLKEGSQVRVEYQRNDPRRALLLEGNRTWWWMNLVSLVQGAALIGGVLLACWLLKLFFKGLMASRR